MSAATAAAIIGSAAVGLGGSLYASSEQEKAQEKAAKKREAAARDEQNRLDKIARDTRPDQESATIEYGSDFGEDDVGSYNDFLVEKTTTPGMTGKSGLSNLEMGA